MTGCHHATVHQIPCNHRRRKLLAAFFLAGGMALLAAVGCGRPASSPDTAPPLSESETILRQMIETYRQAWTYADQGVVRIRYRAEGQWIEDEGRLAVRFERPNRLMLRVYQLTLASDGGRWQIHIADPQTGDLDGQIVVRPAPGQVRLEDIYEDTVTRDVIAGGMGGPPVTLELMLSEHPLEHLFDATVRRELLTGQSLGGRDCHRVQVTLEEGPVVFWIDRQSHLLRRLEYPTDRLALRLDPSGSIQDLTLVADFREASLNVDLDGDDFAFRVQSDAKIVSRFVMPPRPLPSDLLGRLPGGFHFVDLNSRMWTQDALLGKTAVLAWFNIHPASEVCLRQLAEVRRGIAEDEPVVFLAVCTEPTTVGNQQLARLTDSWKLGLPIVRDLAAYGRDVFDIPGAPTVVVLDPRGVVQAFEVGANPALGEILPHVLRQVIAGQDLAGTIVSHFEQQQETYHRTLLEVLQVPLQGDASRHSTLR
jgi:hypothetical protein